MNKSFKNIQEFLDYLSGQGEPAPSYEEGPQPPLEDMFEEDHEHFIGINLDTNDSVSVNEICGYTPIQEVSNYMLVMNRQQARDLFVELAKILV